MSKQKVTINAAKSAFINTVCVNICKKDDPAIARVCITYRKGCNTYKQFCEELNKK